MKNKVKRKDFINELEAMLPPVRVHRARGSEKRYSGSGFLLLRKQMGVKQEDIKAFTQSGISKA